MLLAFRQLLQISYREKKMLTQYSAGRQHLTVGMSSVKEWEAVTPNHPWWQYDTREVQLLQVVLLASALPA